MKYPAVLLAFIAAAPVPALAGEADVVDVEVSKAGEGLFRFEVTVKHADEGWEHYADRWEVVAPDGTVLGSRVLAHPHVDEQPFTRGHTLAIPAGVSEVIVRARDKVHGFGGAEMTVPVPR